MLKIILLLTFFNVFLQADALFARDILKVAHLDSCYRIDGKKCYEAGNYKQAYECLQFADSLHRQWAKQTITSLQKQYDTMNIVREQAYLSTRLENINHRHVVTGIFIFVLVDLLGLLFVMYLQQQKSYLLLVKKNMEWANAHARQSLLSIEDMDTKLPLSMMSDFVLPVESKDKEWLCNFVKLLKKEKIYLKNELSLNDLSAMMNINKNTLSHLINHYFQKTFPALLNEFRVQEAIHLLSSTKASMYTLEAIGEMCGYRNRQHFHLAFKKVTGLTPNDFRKMSMSRDFKEEYGEEN
ncbi:MAG: AraC family transcriptional regulator [Bacteroidales bacterium]|jgi:YesN/AraC family two-component response regulator|nr:AraC family transcriptional regulator [Bacteroidales bacterium]